MEWVVTVRGRQIAGCRLRTHQERSLSETGRLVARHSGPAEVRATLPGLVVRVDVAVGDEVAAGDPLVTVEAMKMQNEIRAPRNGRVAAIEVAPGGGDHQRRCAYSARRSRTVESARDQGPRIGRSHGRRPGPFPAT